MFTKDGNLRIIAPFHVFLSQFCQNLKNSSQMGMTELLTDWIILARPHFMYQFFKKELVYYNKILEESDLREINILNAMKVSIKKWIADEKYRQLKHVHKNKQSWELCDVINRQLPRGQMN